MNIITNLTQYINEHKPLGISDFSISVLGAGEYNQNFTLTTDDNKFVLRVSTSQLSGSIEQLRHEYETLRYLADYNIAPKPLYIDMEGFDFPIMLEEFVEGGQLNTLNENVLTDVGASIADISCVPINVNHPFEVRHIDYQFDLQNHSKTLEQVQLRDEYAAYYNEAKRHLDLLKTSLAVSPQTQSMLIRRDANPTNIIVTDDGMKWIDWEIARIDDPTITLASFVNEMLLYDVQKLGVEQKHMDIVVAQFRKQCNIDDFDELLGNRLMIERIGGLVWGIERMNIYFETKQENSSKLEWYNVVCEKSLQALNNENEPK